MIPQDTLNRLYAESRVADNWPICRFLAVRIVHLLSNEGGKTANEIATVFNSSNHVVNQCLPLIPGMLAEWANGFRMVRDKGDRGQGRGGRVGYIYRIEERA